ncbi:unnamed protein product [Urochloa decumbens]|uniref:AAA+ ATPase domain-containing protein n=1 Tax=Urochloa decumbens TaxID=240449 RepID=A0ABC9AIB7_9POAL
MEVVTGALPSLIPKLADLLAGEYNLHKGVKGEIMFLQAELEAMKTALEKLSSDRIDDKQDMMWARDVRELSYDIEDSIDTFMIRGDGRSDPHGFKKFIDRSLGLLTRARIRHRIGTDIRDIKSRVIEVHERRERYKISSVAAHPVKLTSDPRLFSQYTKETELVGIEETRDEIIKILMGRNDNKMVSIVGFGGLGKTTLAKAVYEKLRAQFDCSAFVSVSQNPHEDKLFQDMFYQLAKKNNARINVIDEIKEFLQSKRCIIVLDDIWDISVWNLMTHALPDKNDGYRIITTTRNFNVAQQLGGAYYKLKPLCLQDSKILLHRRIFGNEDTDKCPDQTAEVSDKILKKCAGVPLAIVTIASLLANKEGNIIEWYKVYKSMGTGLENDTAVSNMRKILSLSYYDMPSHLRICLLYLSVFPEDYMINKVRLINMWIAEGFIQYGKHGQSLFDVGESYFNDLLNRSMIQPVHDWYSGIIEECRVHDMVLDLIRSLSNEDNFVAVLNDTGTTSPPNAIRRLSLQNAKEDHSMTWIAKRLQQVRSVLLFASAVPLMLALENFRVTRVLDLHGCNLSRCHNDLKHLGKLYHLRYLGLRGTSIAQLPREIGNLSFIQTLDITRNKITSLPPTVVHLRNLMFLYTDWSTRLPSGIGNMTCLEYLLLRIDNSTMDAIEEMGQLLELRVLRIVFNKWHNNLVEYLRKLQKIKHLYIEVIDGRRSIGGLDAWVAPQHLCRLNTVRSCWFSTLPSWMNRSVLPNLSFLWIAVKELQVKDLEILGRLPALHSLELEVDHVSLGIHGRFVVGAGLFPCLVHCKFWGFIEPVVFQQGAMPRLRELYIDLLFMWEARETTNGDGSLDMGIRNLPLLQDVFIEFRSEVASTEEVERVKATLRRAAEIHPNHPRLTIL